MQPTIKTSSVLLGVLCSISPYLYAQNDVMNFNMTITQGTCTASFPSGNVVSMGTIYNTQFRGVGSVSRSTAFSITLANCSYAKGATVTVTGDSATGSGNSDYFALSPSTGAIPAAAGIALRLRSAKTNELQKANDTTTGVTWSIPYSTTTPQNISMDYIADYIQIAPRVTNGEANAVVNFNISYL